MNQLVFMQVGVPPYLTEAVSETIAFLPRLVGAVLILIVGWILGGIFARVVAKVADRVEVDKAVLKTPLGSILGGTERAVSTAFGSVAKWFVFALAILAASNVLAVELLSVWVSDAVSYLPALVAGLLIIVLSFVVADFIGDAIERTRETTETAYTGAFATGVRLFLYFTVIVIGLGTMGVETAILMTFAQALSWGIAAAVAIGVGIAIGWGGKDYVANNVDRWAGSARRASARSTEPTEGSDVAAADGGVER